MPDISIRKIAPFVLRPEKRQKTVELRMEYAKGKYILPQHVILTDFLAQNIAMILNLDERTERTTAGKPSSSRDISHELGRGDGATVSAPTV